MCWDEPAGGGVLGVEDGGGEGVGGLDGGVAYCCGVREEESVDVF